MGRERPLHGDIDEEKSMAAVRETLRSPQSFQPLGVASPRSRRPRTKNPQLGAVVDGAAAETTLSGTEAETAPCWTTRSCLHRCCLRQVEGAGVIWSMQPLWAVREGNATTPTVEEGQ